jgi:hypothetical protein
MEPLAISHTFAFVVVLLAGGYMMNLGLLSLISPLRATRFLFGFATTASAHYLELSLRLIAGAAFVVASPDMLLSELFLVFGWMLIITTAVLAAMPWRWHSRFAARAVSRAVPHLRLIATVSLLGGVCILAAATLKAAG